MTLHRRLLGIALTVFTIAPICRGAEKRVPRSSLPPAVAKTAHEQSKGATVRGYTRDTENGRVEYEAEMTVSGHSKDVSIGADGRLLEVEEQVEMNALPSAVQAALKQRAGKGNITKIESITKHGAIVAYEAQVMAQGKRKEIQVGPDGQRLDHEE